MRASQLVIITTTNVPQRITGASSKFSTASFWGISGFFNQGTPRNNKSGIYIGAGNSGQLPITIGTGANYIYNISNNFQPEDLNNMWIAGMAADGVFFDTY